MKNLSWKLRVGGGNSKGNQFPFTSIENTTEGMMKGVIENLVIIQFEVGRRQ